MSKIWKFRPFDSEQVRLLSQCANIPPVLAQLFVSRGITRPDFVQPFLYPKLSSLRDPQDLPGTLKTATRLLAAIQEKRRIIVYGDYDVDGMTGTAILRGGIKLLGGNVGYFIPNRLDEGYGLSCDALHNLKEAGAEVIISVDCGISSCKEAELARELGIELLITDHHTPGPVLPNAAAIAHPQLIQVGETLFSPNSPDLLNVPQSEKIVYPFQELSGAMVALKVTWALGQLAVGEQKVATDYRKFLLQAVGLASMGTVADVVPLLDENRILVRYGLENAIPEHAPIGLQELFKVADISLSKRLDCEMIGFRLAPRLNAAGRLEQASLGVELLITEDVDRAKELARYIDGLNSSRQKLERSIFQDATQQIEEQFEEDDAAFVLASPNWHPGVIGIVAGRLAEKYYRPVIMIAQDKMGLKSGTGSARTIPGFNLYQALEKCEEYLDRFGGHAAAAGLAVSNAQLDSFRAAFCEHAREGISLAMKTAELLIDAELPFGALTLETVRLIEYMSPFGCANQRPCFCSSRVYLNAAPKKMGDHGQHFSAIFVQDGLTLRTVAFGNGAWVEQMEKYGAGPFDIVFHTVINSYMGRERVELHLHDWRPVEST
ncbi:MAG: single-stranded-DNA-specific exonuclease RecJ [Thermoguttaceae bacterium]